MSQCQFTPALVLALAAGHLIDRQHRGRILALCLGVQAAVALALVASAHGAWASREWLLALSVLLGSVKAFQMPAQQALARWLVPPEVLPRALAFSSAGMRAATIGGPALGDFICAAGAAAVYSVSAARFVLASALLLRVRYEHVPPPKEPATLATVLLTRWPIRRRVGRVMFGAVALYGVATLGFGLSRQFELAWLALGVSGAADRVSVVIRQPLVQLDTPDAMRGRVSAVNSIFIGASNQLGEFESGATAALLGPVGSVVLGGVGTLVVAGLWIKLFPGLAQRERLASSGTSA